MTELMFGVTAWLLGVIRRVVISVLMLAGLLLGTTPAAAAAVDGAVIYRQRCQQCHGAADRPGPLAPSLRGVVGRKAASAKFSYSPALTKSGLIWTRAKLDAFLAAPIKLVPGTRMTTVVSDAAQRAAVINYLAARRR